MAGSITTVKVIRFQNLQSRVNFPVRMDPPVDRNFEHFHAKRRHRDDSTQQGWKVSPEEDVRFVWASEEDPAHSDRVPPEPFGRNDGTVAAAR